MATTYRYLLRRRAELETRIADARKRALAPFESELRAIALALEAMEQAGMAEPPLGEPAAFAPPTPGKRGRRGRTTRDMILMALRQAPGLNEAEIARQLDHRWSRPVTPAAVGRELGVMEAEGLVRRSGSGWVGVEGSKDSAPEILRSAEAQPSFSLATHGH